MVLQALDADLKWSSSPLKGTRNARSLSLVAFQQFVNSSTEIVGHPSLRKVMKTDMIRVAYAVRIEVLPNITWKYTDSPRESLLDVYHPRCRHSAHEPHVA